MKCAWNNNIITWKALLSRALLLLLLVVLLVELLLVAFDMSVKLFELQIIEWSFANDNNNNCDFKI